MLPSSEPGFVEDVLMPIAQAASVLLFAGVALRLLRRLTSGSSLMRVELVPVLAAAVVRMVATAAFLIARGADPESQLTDVLGADRALGDARRIGRIPDRARALACPRRESAEQAERGSGSTDARQELQDVIAEAVDDPSLEIVYRTSGDPAEWVDDMGHPVALPEASRDRATTEIRSGGVPIAALGPRSRAGGGAGDDRGGEWASPRCRSRTSASKQSCAPR